MSNELPRRWLQVYQWLAGFCDTATGLLLMFAPGWTLACMGLQHPPQPIAFAGFIGAFVFSVGGACLYAACLPMDAENAPRWQTVWVLTALTRTTVAAFLAWRMVTGQFEPAWSTVAITDGALALFQWAGLWQDWLQFKG